MREKVFLSLKYLFGILLGFILVLVLFLSKRKYRFKKQFLFSNSVMVAILVALILIFFIVAVIIKKKNIRLSENKFIKSFNSNTNRWVLVLTVLLFIWQGFVAYNIFFMTGWDVNGIITGANAMANGDTKTLDLLSSYYSMYPNNLFITYVYAIIFKIVGNIVPKYCLISLVALNCVLNTITCYLVYKVASFFTSKKVAFIGYVTVVLSVGLSSWVVICYTDSLALFIPMLSFYLYAKRLDTKRKYVRYIYRVAAIAISSVGYFIKPQCAIMIIAIILIECVYMFKSFSSKKLKRLAIICVTIVISFVCTKGALNIANDIIGLKIDKEKEFGMTHFLMMSFNEKNQGVYAHDDVLYSSSFKTKKERKKANIERFKERVKDMGISGVISHTHKKMLIVFNDGTFAWGDEGGFYYKLQDLNTKISQFFKSACYNGELRYIYFSSMQQYVWLSILIFSFISCFVKKDFKRKKAMDILWLTLIGIIMYELIFEARARYLYIFVPIFCVVATVGIDLVIKFLKKKIDNNCH